MSAAVLGAVIVSVGGECIPLLNAQRHSVSRERIPGSYSAVGFVYSGVRPPC